MTTQEVLYSNTICLFPIPRRVIVKVLKVIKEDNVDKCLQFATRTTKLGTTYAMGIGKYQLGIKIAL